MPHPLEVQYGLSAEGLLEGVSRRFRAKVALEGVVAEVHLRKKIADVLAAGLIIRYEEHDRDNYPDYTIWIPDNDKAFRIECKNIRDAEEAYRNGGAVIAYKHEANF
jgi:hypothetical protein